ncbi:MAG: AIM24 family protein [Pseudomonadota bacterium]
MLSDAIEYNIYGTDVQIVEILLGKDQSVISEASAMNYMQEGIVFDAHLGDGANPDQGLGGKLFGALKRGISGESYFVTHFQNLSDKKSKVGFSAPYPGCIIPIDLNEMGGEVICQKDAFLVAARGTTISATLTKKVSTGFFSGEGFILQKIKGDGLAFLNCGGTVVKHELDDETMSIESGSLVAFSKELDYSVEMVRAKNMMFSGEGMFLTKLTGTGVVYVSSMPFNKLAEKIISAIHESDSKN